MDNNEFYVGYQRVAPKRTASFIKRAVVVIGLSTCLIALILGVSQRQFSSSVFEYGINSTIEGYYFEKPVPHLAMPLGMSLDGRELFQNVLLVGFGKAGAKEVMTTLQKQEGKPFIGSKIELTGYMIYGNGKALLQVTEEDNSNMVFLSGITPPSQLIDTMGVATVIGEIVDPKCYFGVMKPGEGKSHRSCAIRCVDGGIPPVFHSSNNNDDFLLVNENLEPINKEVLRLIGDQITIEGKELEWNDWKMLSVKSTDLISMISKKRFAEQLMAFEVGMTMCGGLNKSQQSDISK